VIPGEVKLTVEFRDINAWDPILVYERLRHFADSLGGISFRKIVEKEPVRLHPGIQQKIKEACAKTGVHFHVMPSAAGHDAVAMSYLTPTSMIFIPSKGGISHSPDEWTEWEDIGHGADVLLQTIISIDED
jgi:N-carbamoyl-L-amino-acid hydrolase